MQYQEKYIRLVETLQNDNRITYRFKTNLDCFRSASFSVDYGKRSFNASDSIKNVVFAAVMAPISWATGAELSLPCLDKAYIDSLKECKAYFQNAEPYGWSFQDTLVAVPEVNRYEPGGHGLLFSGGLDALTSYIKHQDKRPELFTVVGMDMPLDQYHYINSWTERYREFAEANGAALTFIYTDIGECLMQERLEQYAANWYAQVSHSMLLTGLTAPLTCASIRTLFIASSHISASLHRFWGSDVELDNHIRWGSTQVEYDNAELERIDKVRDYFKGQEAFYKYLRVCWTDYGDRNCGKCEKCLRTILALLINDIDPAACNFEIDEKTLPSLKRTMMSYVGFHRLFRNAGRETFRVWKHMGDLADLKAMRDMYGSRAFFEWFKETDVLSRPLNPVFLKVLFYRLRVKESIIKTIKSCIGARYWVSGNVLESR